MLKYVSHKKEMVTLALRFLIYSDIQKIQLCYCSLCIHHICDFPVSIRPRLRQIQGFCAEWHSNVPPKRLPSIKDCKQSKGGVIDCRNMGFQNVPYDVFSFPGVRIYLSGNPYICDCSLIWFLREPPSNTKRIEDHSKMECFTPKELRGSPFQGIKPEEYICKTKQYRAKNYCKRQGNIWKCHITYITAKQTLPPRVPSDIYTSLNGKIYLNGQFPCDCDTVWLIRRLKTSAGRRPFYAPNRLLCKRDKKKRISKPIELRKVKEAQVCPQKGNDACKIKPCPAKVTKCKYTAKSYTCVDVNECKTSRPCKSPEICVNKIKTGYKCVCPKELVRDEATKKCVPPDPCKQEKNPCPTTSMCETIRTKSKTSHRCVDINECLTGNYTCGDNEKCYNKENGYECRCLPGFSKEKGKCVAKIDPCKSKPPVCDAKTQRCVSEKWDSFDCLDIDECNTQQHDCDENAKCINTEPGYKCQCKPGYKEYDDGRKCKDLNECTDKFICAKHANCENLPGSYKCECKPGYYGDGKYCNDQDECENVGKCSVDAVCRNKVGSYQCICKKGYHGNGRICKDINECTQNKYKCPAHSKCHNTPGSYTCKCRQGFKLKNKLCVDVNECKMNSHNCDKNALCINFVGSYKCRCKDGFEHLKDGRLCLKEEETSENNNTLLIIIAVSASLLLVILISCCLYCQRRNKRSKNNSDSEESKMLLGSESDQQQAGFVFESQANKQGKRVNFFDINKN